MDGRILDIRPDHITNGNQAATLALLWAIAIKFEVRLDVCCMLGVVNTVKPCP